MIIGVGEQEENAILRHYYCNFAQSGMQVHHTVTTYLMKLTAGSDLYPVKLAQVPGQLVQETITDKEGKVEKVTRKTEDEVITIPDADAFSLIVHTSRRNQEWMADTIRQLDEPSLRC